MIIGLILQVILTGLGVFLLVLLTKLLIQNGRAIKAIGELGKRMEEGFRLMDERTEKIAKLIVMESERTRELIKSLKS